MRSSYNTSHLKGIIEFTLAGAAIKAIDLGLHKEEKDIYSIYVDEKCNGPIIIHGKTEEQKIYEISEKLFDEWM